MNPPIPPAGQPYPVPPYPQPPHPHMVPVHYFPVQQFPFPQAVPVPPPPPPAPFDFKDDDDDDDDYRGRSYSGAGNGTALVWVVLLMLVGVSLFFGGYIFLVGHSATSDESRGIVAGISMITAVVLFGLGLIYFIPTFVAVVRKHPQVLPIFIVNLFLGAFLLGFVVALVWACMYIEPPRRRRYR